MTLVMFIEEAAGLLFLVLIRFAPHSRGAEWRVKVGGSSKQEKVQSQKPKGCPFRCWQTKNPSYAQPLKSARNPFFSLLLN
jgi:hypothetical protein